MTPKSKINSLTPNQYYKGLNNRYDNRLKKLLSHDQLEEILNNYELIEELQDLPQLYAAAQDKIEDCQKLVHEIGISFRENNIKQALDLTVKLKYLTNLVGNIKLKIKHANNRD